jgi:hypothetical protein
MEFKAHHSNATKLIILGLTRLPESAGFSKKILSENAFFLQNFPLVAFDRGKILKRKKSVRVIFLENPTTR